jgi:indolepyruvate ferredoxin oxidoreductase beta subunit
MQSINFLLVGVGGQGTILASNILAETGLSLGYDVKKAEVHGMSQRGGSVTSHVRWAEQVFSPILCLGEADYLLAFEKCETLRFLDYLKSDGKIILNDFAIVPVSVHTGGNAYPSDEKIRDHITQKTPYCTWVKAMRIADDLGNVRVANVVLLGTLSGILDTPADTWLAVIERLVPAKVRMINCQAFELGRQIVTVRQE